MVFFKKSDLILLLMMAGLLSACGGAHIPSAMRDRSIAEGSKDLSQRGDSVKELVRNVGDRVFFETNSSILFIDARAVLQRQIEWLNTNKVFLMIEGHADERGTRDYNLALGARRANVVRNYLMSFGVEPYRLKTISYGKERPVVTCSDVSCWAKNRRVVSVVVR